MKRKIVYVTGTRADFGLLTSVLKSIESNPLFELIIYATGMHLMSEFGLTINYVEKFYSNVRIISAIFKENTKVGMAQFIADFGPKFLDQLKKDKPDLIIILGDRVEMLASSVIAEYFGIAIVHIHGGDKTTTVDESARHAISKLAHLHFVATKDSAQRIKKLGEEEWRIHVVGAPSLDNISREKIPSRSEVYSFLNLDPNKKFILLLQHAVTDLIEEAGNQVKETLSAVKSFGLPVVVIYPNSDPGGEKIIKILEEELDDPNFRLFPNVDYNIFLGLEKEAAVWVGNSSAGIIESSSFHTPVVNIGDRQKGRPQSGNVINVDYSREEIKKAINKSLYDSDYIKKIKGKKNIWGNGRTAEKIVKVLEKLEINSRLLTKQITY